MQIQAFLDEVGGGWHGSRRDRRIIVSRDSGAE